MNEENLIELIVQKHKNQPEVSKKFTTFTFQIENYLLNNLKLTKSKAFTDDDENDNVVLKI